MNFAGHCPASIFDVSENARSISNLLTILDILPIFVSPGMIRTGTGGSGNLMFKSTSSSVVESRANNEMMTEQKSGVAGSAPWSPTSGMPIVEMATVESKESKKSI